MFEHYSDVPVLDVRTCTWTIVLASADTFPARRGHSAVLHEASKRIIVCGGTQGGTGQAGCLNDVWLLHNVHRGPAELSWSSPTTSGEPPSPRRGHRAVVCAETTMLIIGGYGEGLLHALTIDEWVWASVPVRGPEQQMPWQYALFGCAMVRDCLLCFGGHEIFDEADADGFVRARHSNNLHAIDLAELVQVAATERALQYAEEDAPRKWPTLQWQQLSAKGGSAPPVERYCLEMADASRGQSCHFLCFGGTDVDGEPLNDTHLLHVHSPHDLLRSRLTWEQVESGVADFAPTKRNAMSLNVFGNRFVLFGGGIFAEKYYSDTWCFELHLEPTFPAPPPFTTSHIAPHLAALVGSERFADVRFVLPDGSAVFAHRLLLCSGGSGYFSALLQGSFSESAARVDGGPLVLTLPGEGWTQAILLQCLRFLYTGDMPVALRADANDSAAVMELLAAADAIELEPLRKLCEAKLASAIDDEQVVEVLILADGMNCRALREFALSWMHHKFGPVRRCAVSLPPPPPVESLSGYERLSVELLVDVKWAVYGHGHGDSSTRS